ncbi:GH39 family glycosyl hydrolase [Paenibacillus sp. FSL K6-2862]|uniref:GH39 family glycosyl hydrolase n=1 Tax=Paenibacillus sp. FSL K6-2862 TaxID=2921484 RepID=UPI0030FC22DD
MDYTYELIRTDEKLPLNIFFHSVRYVPTHWHDSIEILFVLKGNADVYVQNESFDLNKDDLILINSNEIHTIQSDKDNLLLALQIPSSFLKEQGVDQEQITFNCCSFRSGPAEQSKFDEIRALLASIMWVYNKAGYSYEVKIRSLLLELIYLLLRNFRSGQTKYVRTSKKNMERLLKLNEYIQANYNQPLSLNELAERENFSVSYLSRFFQTSMGITFRAYLTRIRLEYAMKDMLTTDYPIIKIALDNGFPNLKSFHKAFKDVYQTTPAEYRKQVGTTPDPRQVKKSYIAYDRENALLSLFKYLPDQSDGKSLTATWQSVVVKHYNIRLTSPGKSLNHTWKTLCTIGKAKEALYGPVQQHLKMVQETVGFRYIRFHGIFDDEMMVYRRDTEGNPIFNFTYVDQVFDFLLSIGLRPFIQLGFIPGEMADKMKTFFYKTSYVSMPQNMEHWVLMIKAFVQHLIDRYGLEEVKDWKFEFWNEPDLKIFWSDSFESYVHFYKTSFDAVKSICSDLQFGGPAILSDSLTSGDWMKRYWTFCSEHNCRPDFISLHIYPVTFNAWTESQSPFSDIQFADENYMTRTILKIKTLLKDMGAQGLELYVTEWNSTVHHRELTNDTCFKSAYIVKNIVETLDDTDSMGYWTITDLLEELPPPDETFHGGLGLVTINGIKKSSFYAYELLARLGNRLLERGEGYCITKTLDGSLQLILYHYCHYDNLYQMNDTLDIHSLNRYHVFTDSGQLQLTFSIEGLTAGIYEIRKTTINREHGSAYDLWLEMGHPSILTPQDVQYLNMCSQPQLTIKRERVSDILKLGSILNPHEVQMFEIRPTNNGS